MSKIPELIPEWKLVLRHAWSIRWIAIAFVLGTIDVALQMFDPPGTFALKLLLSAASTGAGFAAGWARLLAQKELGDGP